MKSSGRLINKFFVFFFFSLAALPLIAYDSVPSNIRIRLLTAAKTDIVFFTPLTEKYFLEVYPGYKKELKKGESVIITLYNNRLAVKTSDMKALLADSVFFTAVSDDNLFILFSSGNKNMESKYSGSCLCYPYIDEVMLINDCNIEEYISGVVRAEGGVGKNEEYFKTQAVIARTYTFRYMDKHNADGYNLCDDTHCQVFRGITSDIIIRNAVKHTEGLVIVAPDSSLIISAFHSNCGGETAPSEYVWLMPVPYLTGVKDPYCTGSKNATWEKKVSIEDWIKLLSSGGYTGNSTNPQEFIFNQPSRMMNYTAGTFIIPFNAIRTALGLRSAWFSVFADGDSLLLKGRGYGHGVGLCQEGAMVMADKGIGYEKIIQFYYPGVKLLNIDFAKKPEEKKN